MVILIKESQLKKIAKFIYEEDLKKNLNIDDIIDKYRTDTKFDIDNSLGNCSFFARDVINWANKNGIKADYVYMPQNKEYREKNNVEWEDHIVPMINGTIIDFTMTDMGVSKNVRKENTIPPKTYTFSVSLFEPNGVYYELGYDKPEINKVYGEPKNINSFDVVEPQKK